MRNRRRQKVQEAKILNRVYRLACKIPWKYEDFRQICRLVGCL